MLIKSISGIRGTVGGLSGDSLTPADIVKFTAAFGSWIQQRTGVSRMVIGRDARPSGDMVSRLVSGTLMALGIDVIDLGLSTTPTVEISVPMEKAGGGIIITASHNPVEWNALKLLNDKGEFISASDGAEVMEIADSEGYQFQGALGMGSHTYNDSYIDKHIDLILTLAMVHPEAIAERKFRIAVDAVNSTGGIVIPRLLNALGVENVIEVNCEPHGNFAHNPEPLAEHLSEIMEVVSSEKCDLGIVVDPDVDRLALICEDGTPFGEEYTLVSVADYLLGMGGGGNTVSNLSSTQALKKVTEEHGGRYSASAVGEVNVVEMMKSTKAVIGGEGNGGIIYPKLHYGRDALVGIALFLTHLAESGTKVTELRRKYPDFHIEKSKINLSPGLDVDMILEEMANAFRNEEIDRRDGVKIIMQDEWVHLRKSNTEPIIRIYAESGDAQKAKALTEKVINRIQTITSKVH